MDDHDIVTIDQKEQLINKTEEKKSNVQKYRKRNF
jgi:hypothetical protein